jgi:CDP-glucose 4,6-dehydratase
MNFKNSKVFITGATGLLGSHLTKALVDQGAEVTALVRDGVPRSLFYSADEGWGLDKRVVTIRGEIENYATIERVLNEYEIDTVFHLAAQTLVGTANTSPIATFRANIEGTWNVLEAARVHQKRVKRIVIASSDKAYGNLSGNAYDESFPLHGDHPYDVSKSCADLISQSYFKTYSLPVSITRCGNFFGPGDLNFSRIIPGTVMSALRNEAPIIRSDGKFIRDYIYAEDGAHAYMTLADQMLTKAPSQSGGKTGASGAAFAGEAFNFSYGLRLSVIDVVNAVLKIMKREDLKPVILNEARHEIPVQTLDSTKAKRELQWKPKLGFDEGLRTTVEWYKGYFSQINAGRKI